MPASSSAWVIGFEGYLGADVGKAGRLVGQVTGPPHAGDIEIALELDFETVNGNAACHRIGVDADGEKQHPRAGMEVPEGFGAVLSPSSPGWLIDHIRRQEADKIEMAELTFRDGFALERLDYRGIVRLSLWRSAG